MSIKSQTGRLLRSPEQIKTPNSFAGNFEQAAFFDEIKRNMFEMYKILTSDTEVKEIDGDYTTIGSEILVPTDSLTITLNPNPINLERVTIKNIGGIIRVDGNGRNIDGSDLLIIDNIWDAPTITYIESQDQWYII